MENHMDGDDLEKKELLDEKEPGWKGPLKAILGLMLLIILLVSFIPLASIILDPEPKNVLSRQDILNDYELIPGQGFPSITAAAMGIDTADPNIKRIADRIVVESCEESRVCYAKALYYYIRDNYDYVSDPAAKEYIESPSEFLSIGGGDCESGAIALGALMESIGIESQIALYPGHAMLRVNLDEAPKRYSRDGWSYLDWTCSSCRFGEVGKAYMSEPLMSLPIY